jgi:limonene-1,2-epoxide hydrolase
MEIQLEQEAGPASAAAIMERLAELFSELGHDPERVLGELEPLYARHVVFEDPIQQLRGREAFFAMNRRLLDRSQDVHFTVLDRAAGPGTAFFEWFLELTPKAGPRLKIEGVTRLKVEQGLVTVHRDYWDLLGATMDAIPVAGPVYRMAVAAFG